MPLHADQIAGPGATTRARGSEINYLFIDNWTLEFLPDTRTYPDISWCSAEQKSVQ